MFGDPQLEFRVGGLEGFGGFWRVLEGFGGLEGLGAPWI